MAYSPTLLIKSGRNRGLNVPGSGAKGLYSVFRINGWGGYAFRIKRASDNATLDVGFTIYDEADWEKVDIFTLGTTYTLDLWYDQSGNGENLTPGTQAPIQWGHKVNGIRSITTNSGATSQRMVNTTLSITDVRNCTCVWAGQMCHGWSDGALYEVGNPTSRFFVGTVNSSNSFIANSLGHLGLTSPMVSIRTGNGASNYTITMNDLEFSLAANTSNPATGIVLGSRLATIPGRAEHLFFGIWDRTLTTDESKQIGDQLYGAMNISRVSTGDRWIFVTDSIGYGTVTNGSYKNGWAHLIQQEIGRPFTYLNLGVSGMRAATVAGVASTLAARSVQSGKFNGLTVAIGTNDLADGTVNAADTWTNIQNIITPFKTAGVNKVVVATATPRNASFSNGETRSGFEAKRQTLISSIQGGLGTVYDAIADVGSDPVIGSDALLSTTYFGDFLHPTVLGHSLHKPYHVNAMLSVI